MTDKKMTKAETQQAQQRCLNWNEGDIEITERPEVFTSIATCDSDRYRPSLATGVVPTQAGFPLVLGANLGGAIAPFLDLSGSPPAARRVPLGNLLMRGAAQERFVAETVKEPGCLRYELNQSLDDPRVFHRVLGH